MNVLYELKGSNKFFSLSQDVERISMDRLLCLPDVGLFLDFAFPSTVLRVGAASTLPSIRKKAMERLREMVEKFKPQSRRTTTTTTPQISCYRYNISRTSAEWKDLRQEMQLPSRTRHVSVLELFQFFCTHESAFDHPFLLQELLRTVWMLDLVHAARSHCITVQQYKTYASNKSDDFLDRLVQRCINDHLFYQTAWECPPGSFASLIAMFGKAQETLKAAVKPTWKRKRGGSVLWKTVPGFSIKLVCKQQEQSEPAILNEKNGVLTSKVTDGSRVLEVAGGTVNIPTVKMVAQETSSESIRIRCYMRDTYQQPQIQHVDTLVTLTIEPNGSASGTNSARELLPLLHAWNQNVLETTQKLGSLLGYCILCNNQMNRSESLERGVGDICMKRYNLTNLTSIALECTDGTRLVNGVQLTPDDDGQQLNEEVTEEEYVTLAFEGGDVVLSKSHWFIQRSAFFKDLMAMEEEAGCLLGERTFECLQFRKASFQRLLDTDGVIDRLFQPFGTKLDDVIEDLRVADFFGWAAPNLIKTIAFLCAGKPDRFFQ